MSLINKRTLRIKEKRIEAAFEQYMIGNVLVYFKWLMVLQIVFFCINSLALMQDRWLNFPRFIQSLGSCLINVAGYIALRVKKSCSI